MPELACTGLKLMSQMDCQLTLQGPRSPYKAHVQLKDTVDREIFAVKKFSSTTITDEN